MEYTDGLVLTIRDVEQRVEETQGDGNIGGGPRSLSRSECNFLESGWSASNTAPTTFLTVEYSPCSPGSASWNAISWIWV